MVALHIAYFEPKGTAILKIGRKKKKEKKERYSRFILQRDKS